MGKTNNILKRYYISAEIELASPLALSSGFDENTDADVLCNGKGEGFIPGTSVAGAFRNYLDKKKDENGSFGYSKKYSDDIDAGRMSSVFISDIYFKQAEVAERDGVKLDYNKTVGNKFDYEIVETGASGILNIEEIVREKDLEESRGDKSYNKRSFASEDFDKNKRIEIIKKSDEMVLDEISTLLSALDVGEIRFGSKKNRGCGWIKIKKVYLNDFSSDNLEDWIKYCKNPVDWYTADKEWMGWKKELKEQSKYVSIKVPLCLTGGISIRKYSTNPMQADYEHITIKDAESGEKIPVVPGSSWNGAIRTCVGNIMRELGIPEIDKKIETWFGTEKKDGQQSMIVFKESILKGAEALTISRNKVNRFDASTVDGALYSEVSYFGGTLDLDIMVQKREGSDGEDAYGYKPLIGLLLLVIKEIEEGYLSIGGQTSVGRGIFKSNGEAIYKGDIETEDMREQCLKELAFLKGGD